MRRWKRLGVRDELEAALLALGERQETEPPLKIESKVSAEYPNKAEGAAIEPALCPHPSTQLNALLTEVHGAMELFPINEGVGLGRVEERLYTLEAMLESMLANAAAHREGPATAEQLLTKAAEAICEIGIMAMVAQSGPHASAAVYRQALIDICNFALKAQGNGTS